MTAKKSELLSEYLGSLFLTLAAITPMILFSDILKSDIGVAVIADAIAVAFVLSILIEMFGPISGAHFNPAVSLMMAYLQRMPLRKSFDFIIVQIAGGLSGVILSHLMFYHEIPVIIQVSEKVRNGGNYLGEVIGTTVLLLAILILIKYDNPRISWNIGFLVGGQLIATSSTMFANPMITIARLFTYSEAGIRPTDSIIFILMQLISIVISVFLYRLIYEE